MKHLLRIYSIGTYCHRFVHLLGNQLRLSSMFSTHSQYLRIGFNITKNLNRSVLSTSAVTRKLACRYFSVKVNVGGEVCPVQDQPEPKKFVLEKVSEGVKVTPASNWQRRNVNTGSALVMKFKQITKSDVRDSTAIENICNQLLNEDLQMSIKEYIDILYCLSVLNFHDQKLLTKTLKSITDLMNEIYKPSPLITSISISLRNLLFRHTPVLNGIIDWFYARYENENMSDIADIIQTLAVLNYFPANAEILLQKMLTSDILEYSSSVKYLNFVWAVSLIDRVPPEMAESVLLPSFRKKIDSILPAKVRNSTHLKLLNIYAHANMKKFKINMDSNWNSMENSWLNIIRDKRRKDPIINNFIDCLTHVLPIRTFNTFVHTKSGTVIDAVCFFDTGHTPITELEFMKKGGIKLAIIVLLYRDLCLPEKKIVNGIVKFHELHLTASNHLALFIPFNEFPAQENLRNKSSYLKHKIETLLPKYGK